MIANLGVWNRDLHISFDRVDNDGNKKRAETQLDEYIVLLAELGGCSFRAGSSDDEVVTRVERLEKALNYIEKNLRHQ